MQTLYICIRTLYTYVQILYMYVLTCIRMDERTLPSELIARRVTRDGARMVAD